MKTHPHFFIFGLALFACESNAPSASSDSADPATGTGETGTGDPTSSTGDMPTTTSPTTGSITDASTGTGTDGETELPEETETDDTGDSPMCGDGIVDEGEDCDDGLPSDDGPCVDGCNNNICGDGYVHAGVEICDAGQQNGMYGGSCAEDCTTDNIPHCGDGILQEGYETCEVGETNGDGVSCDPQHCQWGNSRFIFVSSATFPGDLSSGLITDGDKTGVERADDLCQILAIGGGLPGSYYAWLSDNNGTEDSDAAARIGGAQDGADVVYVMPMGGAVVAHGWNELISNGPSEAIIRNELGEKLNSLPAYVWTNTAMNGTSLAENACDNWTSVNGFGTAGLTEQGSTWPDFELFTCISIDPHLYCVQGQNKEEG